jgi:hypothetical protein
MPSPRPRKSVKSLLGIPTESESTGSRARPWTIVSHAGNAASVPHRKEGRASGDATGKVRQRRASFRHDAAGWRGFGKPPLPHWRWCSTCRRHEMATIATCLTAVDGAAVKRERRPGLDVDTAGRIGVHLWLEREGERDCEGCALACQSCGRHAARSTKDDLSPGDGDALSLGRGGNDNPPILHSIDDIAIMFAAINLQTTEITGGTEDAYSHCCATVILCEDAQKAWYRQGSLRCICRYLCPENKVCAGPRLERTAQVVSCDSSRDNRIPNRKLRADTSDRGLWGLQVHQTAYTTSKQS